MKRIYFLLFAVLSIAFTSCNDDDSTNTTENGTNVTDSEFVKNFGAEVQRDFIGQVVGTDHSPIVGATVKVGSSNVQTDANGVFIVNGADVYERFAHITATKPGFINGSRSLVPTFGKNNVKIMLLPATTTQVIASGGNSTVDLPNGTKIVFDGAFADENGNAYSGNVNVSMFHLESSDENLSSLMPGMLYAKSDSGQPVGLETFGMLHAQLTGSDGQKLQIASGHTAKMTMQIDDTQLASAPSTIPLWHFDEVNGYWKQEGEATKQGNKYVGNVSHFSWWNCDAFNSVIYLTVTVVDAMGRPVSNVGIGLSSLGPGFTSSIQLTDDNGQVSGIIPAEETLLLSAFDNFENVIYSESIGPYTSNATVQIVLTNNSVQTTAVTGTFTKCDGTAIENGYVLMYYGNKRLTSSLNNGYFDFVSLSTTETAIFELEGIDFDAAQTSGRIAYRFSFPETKIEKLTACNSVQEFLYYQWNNGSVNFLRPPVPITAGFNGQSFVISTPYTFPGLFYLTWNNPTLEPGDYTTPTFSGQFWYTEQNMIYLLANSVNNMVFHVNKVGGIGEYVDITFEGTYTNNSNNIYHLRGQAHVIRDN